jgi:hypothetical protein
VHQVRPVIVHDPDVRLLVKVEVEDSVPHGSPRLLIHCLLLLPFHPLLDRSFYLLGETVQRKRRLGLSHE